MERTAPTALMRSSQPPKHSSPVAPTTSRQPLNTSTSLALLAVVVVVQGGAMQQERLVQVAWVVDRAVPLSGAFWLQIWAGPLL
jgi:hypothetical protein